MFKSFATPWTVDHKAPLSMGFPRQEYWNVLMLSPPGDLTDPGINQKLLPHLLHGGFLSTEPNTCLVFHSKVVSVPLEKTILWKELAWKENYTEKTLKNHFVGQVRTNVFSILDF